MKTPLLACCALLFSIALFDCGESLSTQQAPPVACPPTNKVTMVGDLNYPQQNCADATVMAEGQLDSLHYRKVCQATGPTAALPPGVVAARVTECRTTDGRGVFLDVEVCCAQAVEQALEPEVVVRAEGPRCPSWRTRTRANDLHYPDAGSCESVVPLAEAEPGSQRYRNACGDAVPRATRPARVLEARVVECRSGGSTTGVMIDVELCCEAKVFEESALSELTWQRRPEEVRAALGEPRRTTEDAHGVHWSYPIEVARGDRVFPGVTVVFVEGRVNSYYF